MTRADRERVNGHPSGVIWLTGLSRAGKSTLADSLERKLHRFGKRIYVLDGDNIRHGLNKDLDFTDAGRDENIRRVAEVSKLMMDAGLIVITAFISPFRNEREMARTLIGSENFFEVYLSRPPAVCEDRDPKGLYKLARTGRIQQMTGITSAYEIPAHLRLSQIALPKRLTTLASVCRSPLAGLIEAAVQKRRAEVPAQRVMGSMVISRTIGYCRRT